MKKTGTLRRTTAASLLLLAIQPVLAQTQPALIEQVLVTARKRSEDSAQVPISMNVVDGSAIEALHLRTLP